LKKARHLSGLPTIEMPKLDYEGLMSEIKRENKARKRGEVLPDNLKEFDDGEMPPLPLGIPPPHEVLAYFLINKSFPDESFKYDKEEYYINLYQSLFQFEPEETYQDGAYVEAEKNEDKIESDNPDEKISNPLGLVADYGSDESESEPEESTVPENKEQIKTESITPAVEATIVREAIIARPTISAEPAMNLKQTDLIQMVPPALLRKKATKKKINYS
jgi:hypothetical protein